MTATYIIMGSYQGRKLEPIDEADSPLGANALLQEYRLAFGQGWALTIKRVEQDNAEKLQDDEDALPTHR